MANEHGWDQIFLTTEVYGCVATRRHLVFRFFRAGRPGHTGGGFAL